MALVKDGASSSSSSHFVYDVFLSFRGEDTRKNFTDHLYTALVNAGLRTFRDDDEIPRGEDIASELEAAIRTSKSAIIVFSKQYASSSWCLDELLLILQRRNTSGIEVLPIFYDIDPGSVRRQKGTISDALLRHEERFKNEADDTKRDYLMNKVNAWRAALKQVADLGGMVLQNEADGYESKFIQKVVGVIGDKVMYKIPNVASHLVGIDTRLESLNRWLRNGSTDVSIFAICGMGGIGKTTIAKYVFSMSFVRFEYRSFLTDIRETSKQPDGLLRLQRQLLSDILKTKAKKINNVDDGINRIKDAVCRGKVLIVLDDVDEISQLDKNFGMRKWFYPGSKIIVTTRNTQLLKAHGPCEMYNVEGMNIGESLELFSWHAFGHKHPAAGYLELSTEIIKHCQGLPLALRVLGSSLRGKTVDVWLSAMEKLKIIPDHEIQDILKLSYESLEDHDRDLFLEIACFFVGEYKSYVIGILDGCGYFTTVGIENLVDRCLLTVDKGHKLRMHQLLQGMGRGITRQSPPAELGLRTRLWYYRDSFQVLKEESGTKAIQALALDMNLLKIDKSSTNRSNIYDASRANLRTDAFLPMQRLRLLQVNYVQLNGDYKGFPMNLKWLCWHGFLLKSLPTRLPLDSLVAIDMQYSNLKKLWAGKKDLGLLRFLNLSHCRHLVETPDFSQLPSLEELILKDCSSLTEIDESIGMAERLVELNLRYCSSLKKLPRNIGMLKFLEILDISSCSNLRLLPIEEMNKLESLKVFHADGIPLGHEASTTGENPSWFGFIWQLGARPRQSAQLIPWISLSRSLVSLSVVGCNLSENTFPMVFGDFSMLKYLNLSRNPIRCLPDCFNGLILRELYLRECSLLQVLTGISTELLHIIYCPLLEKVNLQQNAFFKLPEGCGKLVEFLDYFKFESLENIDMQIINSLGLYYNLERMKSTQIKLFNNYTLGETQGPIQGVYENLKRQGMYDDTEMMEIFNIFFPGNRVPNWYTSTSESKISLLVPSSHTGNIRCLTTCLVYKLVCKRKYHHYGIFYILVRNYTKNTVIIYAPSCYGVPEEGECMVWLSQWKLKSHELEAGDELIISQFGQSAFEVLQVGVHLLCDDNDNVDHGDSSVQEQDLPSNSSKCQLGCNQHQVDAPLYLVGCCWRLFEDSVRSSSAKIDHQKLDAMLKNSLSCRGSAHPTHHP